MNTLRKTMIAGIASVFLLLGCDNKQRQEEELALRQKYESELMQDSLRADSLEQAFMETLDEIARDLSDISKKEGRIIVRNEDANLSVKEDILNEIKMINAMMEENKTKVADLNDQLKKYKFTNSRLQKLANQAEEKLKQYEAEIVSIKEMLSAREYQITELNQKMSDAEMKNQMLEDLTSKYDKETHTAYYALGSYEKLENQGIMTKKGGFLSLGKDKTLKEDLPENSFTMIDTRDLKSIPLNTKKAKLVTKHPSESYEFKEEGDMVASLEIKDPEKFWETSRYLVVEVK